MTTDPFRNFERSRFGLSIPLALFTLGGVLSYLAISALYGVLLREEEAVGATQKDPSVESVEVNPSVALDVGEGAAGKSDELGSLGLESGATGATGEK